MTTSPDAGRLRVMTYNLKGLQLSRADAVAVVRIAAPDVLGVQEPPRGLLGRWRMRRFAPGRRACGPAVNGRGARTTALLVAPGRSVSDARALGLVNLAGRHPAGRAPWPPSTACGSSSCTCRWSATSGAAHLSDILLDHVPPRRTVVLGDLNERPGGPTWKRLTSGAGRRRPRRRPDVPRDRRRVHRIDAVFAIRPTSSVDGARRGRPSPARPSQRRQRPPPARRRPARLPADPRQQRPDCVRGMMAGWSCSPRPVRP